MSKVTCWLHGKGMAKTKYKGRRAILRIIVTKAGKRKMECKILLGLYPSFLLHMFLDQALIDCQMLYSNVKDNLCKINQETELRMGIKIQELENELNSMRAEQNSMKQSESVQNAMIREEFEGKLSKLRTRPGSAYIRWGRTSCPSATASIVYKGYIAGKHVNDTGSGTNTLCLHNIPRWGRYKSGTQGGRAFLYGGEYEPDDGESSNLVRGLVPDNVNDQIAPCAVCRTKTIRTTLMIPGTNRCQIGWTKEYDGYIMASRKIDVGSSTYICVDRAAEIIPGGRKDNQFLLYPTEVKCGALRCPPYVDGREVTCVVCSG